MTLHTIWDEGLINLIVSRNYSGNATLWSEALVRRAQDYRPQWAEWVSCEGTVVRDPWRACTDVWITESNRLCMSHVYRYNATGPSFNATTGFAIDDSTGYAAFNLPIVEHQIIRAGVRLAEVLNRVFAAAPAPPQPHTEAVWTPFERVRALLLPSRRSV